MIIKRFSAAKIESEGHNNGAEGGFEDDIKQTDDTLVTGWRPTLRQREGSSTFHIPASKLSHKSYFDKRMQEISDRPRGKHGAGQFDMNRHQLRMQVERYAAKPHKACCRNSYARTLEQSLKT